MDYYEPSMTTGFYFVELQLQNLDLDTLHHALSASSVIYHEVFLKKYLDSGL